ncbi:unnamed protein product [Gongylonema pulchrum]|uniref:Secreted protein n=1 Tax=Gongylonema pulchrum TaxID=637853 RepID=A0A183CWM7_9BILA|nr:unnamed protein product [Gongylonema pulchrum]
MAVETCSSSWSKQKNSTEVMAADEFGLHSFMSCFADFGAACLAIFAGSDNRCDCSAHVHIRLYLSRICTLLLLSLSLLNFPSSAEMPLTLF